MVWLFRDGVVNVVLDCANGTGCLLGKVLTGRRPTGAWGRMAGASVLGGRRATAAGGHYVWDKSTLAGGHRGGSGQSATASTRPNKILLILHTINT